MGKRRILGVILGWIGNGSRNGVSWGTSCESYYRRERGTGSGV
jgi:hypothetical protein